MPEIEELKEAVVHARAALRSAESDLLASRIAGAEFQVGDVVLSMWQGKPQSAIVREVKPNDGYRTWYAVSFRLKSGEWSTTAHDVFGDVQAFDV